jgi:pimeloyl-ACP methyl ester carboxylesterase
MSFARPSAHGLTARERWALCWPLVLLYRLAGPSGLLLKAWSAPLLGPEALASQPDRSAAIVDSFATANREGMYHAMRSMMLSRPDMASDVARIDAPTLFVVARDDGMGWQIADAQRVASTMRNASVDAVAGTGHVSPLLLDTQGAEKAIREFWSANP